MDIQQISRWLSTNVLQQKAVPGTPSGVSPHGPGGLLSHPAVEQPLYSAVITPWTGLQYVLPVRGTTKTDPLYGIVTGVTATTGAEPLGVCDNPPTAGLAKICMQAYNLGRQSRQSRVIDISFGGRVTDRGEHTDFVVLGGPAGLEQAGGMIPSMPFSFSQLVNSDAVKALIEWMVAWSRDFASLIYTGNPANNTAGGGYKEPYGLNIIINTGHRDAETGGACPAADSIVRSFGGLNITTSSTSGQSLVRLISYVFRNLQHLAAQANLAPVQWVIAMPFGLFYEITEVWPIAYATYRANNVPAGSTQFVDSMQIERMRDEMRGNLLGRQGQYLLIDGQKVPVIIDDAIPETSLPNAAFSSSIYFVPLRILGGREATFIEYLDYRATGVLRNAQMLAPMDTYAVSDNGRFLIHKKPPTNFCVQMLALTEWRVVCTVPYLAARITNVAYTPLIHERSGDPSSSYFVDGGRTSRTGYGPSYWPPS